jgi:uroporphyrinogen-III synthase
VGEATPKGPLKGKRIVVTRAAEQSETLIAALQAHGATPIVLPLIEFAPPDDVKKLDETVRGLQQFDWIFLTSQNALRALQEASQRIKLSLAKAVGKVAIAVVGPRTAVAAREAGLVVRHEASKHDGASLAKELAPEIKGKRVLLPRSDRANQDLVVVLNELGALVTEVVAYKTIRPSSAEDQVNETIVHGAPDAVLFFSPSAVHHLRDSSGVDVFSRLSQKMAFAAIGPITERALRSAGVERIVKAEETTVDGIIHSLIEYFGQSRPELSAGVKHG